MLGRLLRRPVILVVLTIALVAYPSGDRPGGVQIANVTPADLAAVLLVGFVGLRLLAGANVDVLRSRIMLCPVVILAAAIITTAWSTYPVLSLVGVARYAELFCVVPLAVVLVLRDRVDVVLLLGAVVALGAVEGVIGIYQAITGTGASYAGDTIRAVGTFGASAPIGMATVVSCAQLVLMAVALRGRPGVRIWAAAGAIALLVPLALSLSRGALLASLVAAAIMVLCTGVLRAAVTAVVVVAVAIVALALTGGLDGTVGERFGTIGTAATEPDKSVQDRYDLWATAVSIWQASPVTGVGIKQFPAYRDTYAPVGMSSGSDQASPQGYDRAQLLSPHNEYLLLLSEQGVLGLGAHVLLLVVLGGRHLALLRAPARRDVHDVLRLVALGLFVRFLIDGFYGDLAGSTAVLYSVLLGLQLRSAVSHRTPLLDERSPARDEATDAGERKQRPQ